MKKLEFEGDITLDEIFMRHKEIIYDCVTEGIQRVHLDKSIDELGVIKIVINKIEYVIHLSRSKFLSSLKNAVIFYEKREQYEKCKICMELISVLMRQY